MMDDSIFYIAPGYIDEGYFFEGVEPNIPAWAVNPITEILPSYLYQEYQPDNNVESFFLAYNNSAQNSLDYLINLNLPVWTSNNITGILLDWVALNLYGFSRPYLTTSGVILGGGVYNSVVYNKIPYNEALILSGNVTSLVNDDIFKRVLTWNLYKGDGFQFNVRWLKNRIYRFLNGVNGTPLYPSDTNDISVIYSSGNNITITINPSTIATILQEAITSEILQLPFQYNFTVVT
jgi:hypothetical protein